MRQRMQDLFQNGAPVLATDPQPMNKRAIAVYKKLGFIVAGSVRETEWGTILPMAARRWYNSHAATSSLA